MWGGGGGVRRRNVAEGFYFAEEFLNFGVLFVSGGGEGSVVGDNLLGNGFLLVTDAAMFSKCPYNCYIIADCNIFVFFAWRRSWGQ